jgi:abortive infection bacteriophage resistance protein
MKISVSTSGFFYAQSSFLDNPIMIAEYLKAPISPADLIIKLKTQGLTFVDETKAQVDIAKIGYFRFRGYLHPYIDSATHPRTFIPNATFEKALDMYLFDDALRKLVFNILPFVEIALRSTLDATMCNLTNHGFWYLEKSWYNTKPTSNSFPEKVIQSLYSNFSRSSEAYATHYHNNYYNSKAPNYKGMPPFWVIGELTTLGQIVTIYDDLKENAPSFPITSTAPKSTVLDKMSHTLGATHYRDLISWMYSIRDMRNICAHHGRLWNRNLRAPSNIKSKVSIPFPIVNTKDKTNTVYAALVALRLICKAKGIDDEIKNRLTLAFNTYPEARNHLYAMGIPERWDEDHIWR